MNIKQLIVSFLLTVFLGTGVFAVLAKPGTLAVIATKDRLSASTLDTVPAKKPQFPLYEKKQIIDLKDPSSIEKKEEFDPASGQYIISEKIGNEEYSPTIGLGQEDYLKYKADKQEKEYFDYLSGKTNSYNKKYDVKNPLSKYIPNRNLLDRLFGGTEPVIKPQGNIDLTFGFDYSRVNNPIFPVRQQRVGGFDFDMNIQMNVVGKIGEKLNLSTQFNNNATFDFENQMKLDYNSTKFNEDEIIRSIEAGNVALPLKSTLIQGSNALFGVKTELQFGYLKLTALASQQKSRRKEIELKGGKELQLFELKSDEYDENKHFFLTHYFRDHFEDALTNMPQVKSLVRINKVEVWVTNDRLETARPGEPSYIRDVVAIADLGETERFTNKNPELGNPPDARNPDIFGIELPANNANDINARLASIPNLKDINRVVAALTGPDFKFQQIRDFEKIRARSLKDNEYTLNRELGTISVNVNLKPADVLGVAIEYVYNGKTYRIGQFGSENPADPDNLDVMIIKMLKSSTPRIDLPIWDLMMKNVYSVGAYNVDQEEFRLDVLYEDPGKGQKRFLPATNLEGRPLIEVLNLDNLNRRQDPFPDGFFDYVPGLTVNTRTGRVMFPVLEPFGSSLSKQITNPDLRRQYTYQQLYDSTVTIAREFAEFNRFTIKGSFRSNVSSDISLGVFNLPPNSEVVTAGGRQLERNVDYTIDYNTGRVKIINDSYLLGGVPVKVSFEDNSLFSFQTRTMFGLRADYQLAKNMSVGGTFLQLFERPFTQKVNVGEDPINNKIYGLDFNAQHNLPGLTKLLDRLPLVSTKEMSTVNFLAETAMLRPGHSSAINETAGGEGNVYIDDFEGATNGLDIRAPAQLWFPASVPQSANNEKNQLFPESQLIDSTYSGANRAKLSWYRIDETLRSNLAPDDQGNDYIAGILQREIFPNRQILQGQLTNIQTFDLHFEPSIRGIYNMERPQGTPYSAGLLPNGKLKNPESRWGGIMRNLLNNNDFEAANYEYIEFWMLSPYIKDQTNEGELYINLGNVSEDVLRDSRQFFENSLPSTKEPDFRTDQTRLARVPRRPPVNNAFDAEPEVRQQQDVGLDGLNDDGERQHFNYVLEEYKNALVPMTDQAIADFEADPSNDNFKSFQDESFNDQTTIFEKYSRFNGQQGNNQAAQGNQINSNSQQPDNEDIVIDNTLNEAEAYFEYKIPLTPDGAGGLNANKYIVESIKGPSSDRIWYRFVIPIREYSRAVGGIADFRSIRFIRLYMHGFEREVTCRFATFELIRSQWRKYQRPFGATIIVDPDDATKFDVNAVGIEENNARLPFNYVTPPGIIRENTLQTSQDVLQDEQSIAVDVCNLKPGDSRAIYKLSRMDLRVFDRMRMFVHAESKDSDSSDLKLFFRFGSDFEANYYEYEMPLKMSNSDNLGQRGSDQYAREVWRNEMDVLLENFRNIKTERNNTGASLTTIYEKDDPDRPSSKIRIFGNPNLGLVKGFMIGVRNVDEQKAAHCAQIWVNELRVNGFNERNGYAGLARMDVKLADLGRINLAGNFTSIGWGSLEQRVGERKREQVVQYDGALELELSKFLPQSLGIKIPMLAQVSNTTRTPEFDPYDLDIPLKEKLKAISDADKRKEARKQAEDYNNIQSLNFANIRKERRDTKAKPKPWDVENLSLSYGYTQTDRRDPFIEQDQIKNYQGSLDYNYARQVKYVEPFKNIIKDNKWVRLLSQFNFNPVPNGLVFRTNMDRDFQQTKYRFAGDNPATNTFFDKRWAWDRSYNTNWDLAKSLKLTFNALNTSLIDERPETATNPATGELYTRSEKRDFIKQNIRDGGRTRTYKHDIAANYTLPTKQIPFLAWTTVRAQVSTGYTWNRSSLNTDSLGNIISNTQQRQITGDFDFESIYNSFKYLKKIDKKNSAGNRTDAKGVKRQVGKPDAGLTAKDDPDNPNAKKADKAKEKKPKEQGVTLAERILIRPLLTIRRGKLTYSENFQNSVPGFLPSSKLLGSNDNFSAPGVEFLLGQRPSDAWLNNAASRGWITSSIFLNQPVSRNYTREINGQLKLEPFSDFKVDLDVKQNYSLNRIEDFKKPAVDQGFQSLGVREVGSFTVSFLALNTLFVKDIDGLFQKFEDNRTILSKRLGTGQHPVDFQYGNYTEGYGRYQQDVLIPSFIAAYTKADANKVSLTDGLFRTLPKPNWRLNYAGLAKLPGLKDIFTAINITHAYNSTLTVNNFNTNAFYNPNSPTEQPATQNYFAKFEVPTILIREDFSPLIGLDMKLKNDMNFRFEFKKSRNLQMSFVDNTLAESQVQEFTIGYGYRIKNIDIPFLVKKNPKKKPKKDDKKLAPGKSKKAATGRDLNIKFDFSYRDDVTSNHFLDQNLNQKTRGATTIRLTPNADYQLNKRLSLRVFWEYNKVVPKTTESFPTVNTSAGVMVRFSLQ